jgi:CO/xanthine dehydrogenase Mo-binding subunit
MSKAARIRELLDQGKVSQTQIAAAVGCLPEYVRSVKQRRGKPHGLSNGDASYLRRRYGAHDLLEAMRRNARHRYRRRQAARGAAP